MKIETRAERTGICLILAGVLIVAGCNRSAPTQPDTKTSAEPVSVISPQRKSLRRVVEQPGTIQAYEEAQLFARVPGYVRLPQEPDGQITTDIGRKIRGPKRDESGKEVAPGDVLAEIVVPELEEESKLKNAMVRQTQADVEQAKGALASAEANIATVEALLVEAKANNTRWQSELTRISSLVKNGVIDSQTRDETQQQFTATAARVTSAEAGVRKAKADRDKARADVQSAEARVDVAKADASRAEAMLSYAKIRAPFDGVVSRRRVNTGDFVQPSAGKGEWLFVVSRIDPVRVVVSVPEADAALVQEKSPVALQVPSLAAPALTGTVTRTSWSLDPGARTLRAEIDLPNKEGMLRPGMYVYARITGDLPERYVLPNSALAKQGDTMVCFRINAGKAVRTPVQVGRNDGTHTEVLKWLKPGTPSSWEEWAGNETIALRTVGLSDGQSVQTAP